MFADDANQDCTHDLSSIRYSAPTLRDSPDLSHNGTSFQVLSLHERGQGQQLSGGFAQPPITVLGHCGPNDAQHLLQVADLVNLSVPFNYGSPDNASYNIVNQVNAENLSSLDQYVDNCDTFAPTQNHAIHGVPHNAASFELPTRTYWQDQEVLSQSSSPRLATVSNTFSPDHAQYHRQTLDGPVPALGYHQSHDARYLMQSSPPVVRTVPVSNERSHLALYPGPQSHPPSEHSGYPQSANHKSENMFNQPFTNDAHNAFQAPPPDDPSVQAMFAQAINSRLDAYQCGYPRASNTQLEPTLDQFLDNDAPVDTSYTEIGAASKGESAFSGSCLPEDSDEPGVGLSADSSVPTAPNAPIIRLLIVREETRSHASSLRRNPAKFRCSVGLCRDEFTNRMNVERHVRAHLGIKAFGCPRCGSTLTSQSDLNKHLRTMGHTSTPESIDQTKRVLTENSAQIKQSYKDIRRE